MENLMKLFDYISVLDGPYPYLVIFLILFACGMGLPIPEDIILIAAGLLCYHQIAHLQLMVPICFLGVMLGDSIMFFLGAKYGRKLLKIPFFKRFLHAERMEFVTRQFQKRGSKIIFIARFMPGLRALIFFSSGMFHLSYFKFLFYDGLAALLSVPAIVLVTYEFGEELNRTFKWIKNTQEGLISIIIFVLVIFFIKKYLAKKNLQKKK